MTKMLLNICPNFQVFNLITRLTKEGHLALIIGGAVRDALLNKTPNDIDVEVYNISIDDLTEYLQKEGPISITGKKFGIVKLSLPSGIKVDFSIPRKDSKIGVNHTDFATTFDSNMSIKSACERRDFTICSMAYNITTGTLYDYFGGQKDLKNKVLRHTSSAFIEDPLRVLRGMGFVCRFDLTVAPETASLCKDLSIENLSKERVAEEWLKWSLSDYPEKVIDYLVQTLWIRYYPELLNMIGSPQDPIHHPETSVESHTYWVIKEAKAIADRESLTGKNRQMLIFAALLHDIGKPVTSKLRDVRGELRWTNYGHEIIGAFLAEEFLQKIGVSADKVVNLVRNHMQFNKTSISSVRKLADRLYPATIKELLWLMEADYSGRPPLPKGLGTSGVELKKIAQDEGIYDCKPQRPIEGRDVIEYMKPGPAVGIVVKEFYSSYLNGKINSREQALNLLRNKHTKLILTAKDLNSYEKPGPNYTVVLKAAQEAQGIEFNTREEGLLWLAEYYKNYPVKSRYERKETYSVEKVLELLHSRKLHGILDGDKVSLCKSDRLLTFRVRGTSCASCGLKGEYFAKERSLGQETYHLNLYGLINGEEVMLTLDHVIPKSKGGKESMYNYQVLCAPCNERKADKIETGN